MTIRYEGVFVESVTVEAVLTAKELDADQPDQPALAFRYDEGFLVVGTVPELVAFADRVQNAARTLTATAAAGGAVRRVSTGPDEVSALARGAWQQIETADERNTRAMDDPFGPYRAYLAGHGVDVEAYRYGAAERDDILYGALIAMDANLELSPLDQEREFWPAIDAGFGLVADLIANLLATGRAVVPNWVANQVADRYRPDTIAAIARSAQVTAEDASDRQAAADLVRCWAELARSCAVAWLCGAGHPEPAVARLDGLYSVAAVHASRR
jgi:hypothetical protein